MAKSRKRKTIVQNRKADAEVIGYVGQQGLDSLKVQYPDWDKKPPKEKSNIAKNSDPIIKSLYKDFEKLNYSKFYDKWSILNERNQLTVNQAKTSAQLADNLYKKEQDKLGATRKGAADKGRAMTLLSVYNRNLEAFSGKFFDEKTGDVQFMNPDAYSIAKNINLALNELIDSDIDLTDPEALEKLNDSSVGITSLISRFVNNIDIDKFKKTQSIFAYENSDGSTTYYPIGEGKPIDEVKMLIQGDLFNKYNRIVEKIISSASKRPATKEKSQTKKIDISKYKTP